ncbi:acyltransferase family protein [Nocardioides marmorisolisilvae]|uniref:Acyltransferase n=1 Tax=Nocardioides marmorisolisilvae TaxID=1542737 RepID=A0A3N0DPS0_9ACTN|nr:acyltransferase [Nocardioides marmorisolisilvae]RNL77323.1 acyltransferase [Nocardioides marmorisolisilvae]
MREAIVRDRGHLPALDGLRGVAILLVLGQHAPTRPLIDGFVGVTVFFCLSGYLITTLLLRELDGGGLDLRGFYRRRVARLGPALVVVVVVTTAVVLIARPDLRFAQTFAPAGAALTYTTSLFDWGHHPFASGDYFNYTWTLSIEEQFYLLWPLALFWSYRRDPRLLAALTAVLIGFTLTVDLYLGLTRAVKYDPHEYFGTDTNALPILVGAMLALVLHQRWLPRTLESLAPAALPALCLLPLLGYLNETYHPSLVIASGTGLALLALVGLLVAPRSAAGAVLASAPLRWLGERSYSIYLWNVLARAASINLLGHTWAGDLFWIFLFLTLGEASYRYVERPLRARFARRPKAPVPALA